MSAVKLGLGTQLKRGATAIPELTNIAINPARESVDVTNHDSTQPNRDFIAGLLDNGEVTFDFNFLPGSTNQKLLTTDLFAVSPVTEWSIVWIDGPTTWTFDAFVRSFNPSAAIGDQLKGTGSLKVTGPIVIT